MSVSIDGYCSIGFGTLGRMANTGYHQNVTLTVPNFMTVGSGATFMIAATDAIGDLTVANSTNTGNLALTWDFTGTPQSMTPIGTPIYNSIIGNSLQLWGLVNPNPGSLTLGIINAGNTVGNQNAVFTSVSFFGTDPAGSVASVTSGFAAAKDSGSTSNPATATTTTSIPIGGMAFSVIDDDSIPLTGWPSDGGAVLDNDNFGTYFETYTGAGSPITVSGVGSPAGFWDVAIVGILPVGGGGGGSPGVPFGIQGLASCEW